MLRNLLAFMAALCVAGAGVGAFRLALGVFGGSRAGRGAAFVASGALFGMALGILVALTNDGWHKTWRMRYQTHTSLTQGLVFGVAWGVRSRALPGSWPATANVERQAATHDPPFFVSGTRRLALATAIHLDWHVA